MQNRNFRHLDDQELLDLLSQSNRFAFREIYNRYWEELFRLAINILNDKDTSEDLLQEIFINIWQRRQQVNISNLWGFLFRAVKVKVLEHLRNGKGLG